VEKKGIGQERMKGCVGGGQGSKRTVVPLMMMMMMTMTMTTLKGSFEDSRKQMLRQSCEGDFKKDVHKWFQPCL
jgi:hypothetical protein